MASCPEMVSGMRSGQDGQAQCKHYDISVVVFAIMQSSAFDFSSNLFRLLCY